MFSDVYNGSGANITVLIGFSLSTNVTQAMRPMPLLSVLLAVAFIPNALMTRESFPSLN